MTNRFRDFKAMAVRAAYATFADGVVFSETSRDALDKNWEQLPEETRTNWREMAEVIAAMFNASDCSLTNNQKSGTTHH